MHCNRIPVYVVTGFLGSGKSTLLSRWLKEAPFDRAALIVNEIGEIGIDHATLGFSGDASTLLADACVCCTGLPALNEALEQLFWARLHRSTARFEMVVIETTGLADPGPLVAALSLNAFVKERYAIAGTFTTIAASNALETLSAESIARAQLQRADVVIITKADRVNADERLSIESTLRDAYPGARIAHSAHASLRLEDALACLSQPAPPVASTYTQPFSRLRPHGAETRFIGIDEALDIDALHERVLEIKGQYGEALLRLKGLVRVKHQGSIAVVQFARGDAGAQITTASMNADEVKSGLTVILRSDAMR
ncbi:GTP-binding protein [Caballeronia sp. INDeC2]|uniref:CobW family GTP-binding protein n=1 Tax=Caballeronia sp. INDeC2 TaxID=2921747 RepID=UPI002027BFC7|nr:GTP-binding protein [Caballeronia sp. INDeC2]